MQYVTLPLVLPNKSARAVSVLPSVWEDIVSNLARDTDYLEVLHASPDPCRQTPGHYVCLNFYALHHYHHHRFHHVHERLGVFPVP